MNVQQSKHFSATRIQRRLALCLVGVVLLAGMWILVPDDLFSVPVSAQRRGSSAAAGKPKNIFIHDKNHIRSSKQGGRLVSNCDECHRIPGAFYVSENAAGYNVREFPDHPDCLRCHEHRKDFFRGAAPPICTVCHKGASPREKDPGGTFPKATGPDVERDFTGRFPHGKHQDILAFNDEPARASNGFQIVKASFRAQDNKTPQRWDCGRCHVSYPAEIEKQMLVNIDWAAAKVAAPELDKANNLPLGMKSGTDDIRKDITKDPTAPAGTFKQSPNGPTGHKYCFECHALTQGAWNSPYPRANDCVGCHGLGKALEPAQGAGGGVAKTITPLGLTEAGRKATADPSVRQKYGLLETLHLLPRISYKFQHDISAHDLECTVCHVNITRQQTLSVANPDVPMASCSPCHLSTGGGSINLKEEMDKKRCDNQYVCSSCHTPDTGKNSSPDSHFAVFGKTRINYEAQCK